MPDEEMPAAVAYRLIKYVGRLLGRMAIHVLYPGSKKYATNDVFRDDLTLDGTPTLK